MGLNFWWIVFSTFVSFVSWTLLFNCQPAGFFIPFITMVGATFTFGNFMKWPFSIGIVIISMFSIDTAHILVNVGMGVLTLTILCVTEWVFNMYGIADSLEGIARLLKSKL